VKKKIVIIIAFAVLALSGAACSERYVASKPTDNHTYTAGEIEQIARGFDPDCRKFTTPADNITPG
jgi:hypothetical protein